MHEDVTSQRAQPLPRVLNLNARTYMPEGEENFYGLKMMGFFSDMCQH